MDNDEKLKLATSVPEPPELTTEALRQIGDQAKQWRTAFALQTSGMEVMTADDLKVRAR